MEKTADKRRFRVAAGIESVAGQPVPKNRIVYLTEREALYEQALGRVETVTSRAKEN